MLKPRVILKTTNLQKENLDTWINVLLNENKTKQFVKSHGNFVLW